MTIIQEVQKKTSEKERVLESAKKLFDARDEIINLFEKGTFPYKHSVFKTKKKEKLEEKNFFAHIENESKDINYELFKNHFKFVAPMAKKLFETKDKNKNNKLVNVINSGLIDLKYELEKMSKKEIEIEKPDKILKIVEEILNFNKKIQRTFRRTRLKNIIISPNA